MKFSVKSDVKKVMSELSNAQRKIVPQAVSASLNRAVKQAQTASIKDGAAALNIKSSVMRNLIRFQKRDRASVRKWIAGIFAVISDVKASKLGPPRQFKAGARAGKFKFPGAFVATMPRGHTGIYKRSGKKRLPIKEMKVPVRDKIVPIIENKVQTIGIPAFQNRFYHELEYRLRARGLL